MFAAVTPPLQAPDEIRHLQRTFAILSGQMLAASGPSAFASVSVPRSAVELEEGLGARRLVRSPRVRQDREGLRAELLRPLDPDDRVAVPLPSLYSPVAYLPAGLGIAAARLLDLSAAACVYAGRLGNLVMYALVVALALRRTPAHHFALGMLAVTPMAVFEGAALGADAATNALALLFTALVLRAAAASGPPRRAEWTELAMVAALLGLSKQAYVPLVLAVVLVPASRFAGARARLGAVAAVTAAGVVPAVLWFLALRELQLERLVSGSDPEAQIVFLVQHPLQGAEVLLETLGAHFERYVRTFVGQLGYLDVLLPRWVYTLQPLALVAVSLFDGGRDSPVRGAGRALFVAVAVLTWLSVVVLAYVGWNVPGDDLVRYVQGRYFIPLAPLLACAVHLPRGGGLPRVPGLLAAATATALLALSCVLLVQRYW